MEQSGTSNSASITPKPILVQGLQNLGRKIPPISLRVRANSTGTVFEGLLCGDPGDELLQDEFQRVTSINKQVANFALFDVSPQCWTYPFGRTRITSEIEVDFEGEECSAVGDTKAFFHGYRVDFTLDFVRALAESAPFLSWLRTAAAPEARRLEEENEANLTWP